MDHTDVLVDGACMPLRAGKAKPHIPPAIEAQHPSRQHDKGYFICRLTNIRELIRQIPSLFVHAYM
jgi:hypothetical protein